MNLFVRLAIAVTLLLATPVVAAAPAEPAPARPRIEAVFTPQYAQGRLSGIAIRQTLHGLEAQPGAPMVSVPVRVAFTYGQDYREQDFNFSDAAGPLPVQMQLDDPPAGHPLQWRHFIPGRATRGPVQIEYAATITPALSPRPRGPSYDLRGIDGGAGGAYFSFLLLPVQAQSVDFHPVWELGDAPDGARYVSTHGPVPDMLAVAPMQVYATFFLFGNVHGQQEADAPFHAYWIGTPPFHVEAGVAWSARVYDLLRERFRDPDAGRYTFLMRPYLRPRDGGGATRGGFMLEYGAGAMSDSARRIVFAHEIIHHFIQGLEGDSSAIAWFGEGLAELYKIRLALDEGLADPGEVAHEIQAMARAYYLSPLVNTPYDQVAGQRWAGGGAQGIPYNRGFMYFSDLDHRLRSASQGRTSLDNLVVAMLERHRDGQPYGEPEWRALLREALGAEGEAHLDRMLAGELIVPAPDAFGPCFQHEQTLEPRRSAGMSEDSFLVTPYRVTELEPGSPAEAAGLREGDRILSFTGVTPNVRHSADNVDLDDVISIVVERDGRPQRFSYRTAQEQEHVPVHAWNWNGKDAAHCGY